MYSKFPVLSKFWRFSNFNRNSIESKLKLLLDGQYGNMRSLFTKTQINTLVTPRQNVVVVPANTKKIKSFKMACNMSSSHNNEGNGKRTKHFLNQKKLFKMRKRRSLQSSNRKDLKKSKKIYKLSETNADNKDAGTKSDSDLVFNFKSKAESANNENMTKAFTPHKNVHVEFMESKNLKDFNLDKSDPSRSSFNNLRQRAINTKPSVTPSFNSHYDKNVPNKNEGKALTIVKTQESKKESDSDIKIKTALANKKTHFLKETSEKESDRIERSLKMNKSIAVTEISRPSTTFADGASSGSGKQESKVNEVDSIVEEKPKKSWRKLSLTVLPLMLVITGYALSNLATH